MSDAMYPTIDIKGAEIFSSGVHNADFYSNSDLDAMVTAFSEVGFEPTVKAGHATGQDELDETEYRKIFGAPALGYVSRLYRSGNKLIADLKQVPRKFADLIKAGSYKRISSEVYWSYRDDSMGKTWPRVLKSVAFLGAEIPAVTGLKSIEALFNKAQQSKIYYFEKETIPMTIDHRLKGSLSETSTKLDAIAKNYAKETGCTYLEAVKAIIADAQEHERARERKE